VAIVSGQIYFTSGSFCDYWFGDIYVGYSCNSQKKFSFITIGFYASGKASFYFLVFESSPSISSNSTITEIMDNLSNMDCSNSTS